MPTLLPAQLKSLSERISNDIDDWCIKTFQEGHRNHLGASVIGEECDFRLWGVFRWFKVETHDGRKHRLFQTGHREEARYIEYLRGIGFTIYTHDEATGKQFRVSGVNGHFGGSLDAVGIADSRYPEIAGIPILIEFKTNGTGQGFSKLFELYLASHKPVHYKQMCSYGKFYGFEYGLYINKNKNDDEIYVEVIWLDWSKADDSLARADKIINAIEPPHRIAKTDTYFKCKFCHLSAICHHGVAPETNCRSCKFSRPIDNAQWNCLKFNAVIPPETIAVGCAEWSSIV